MKDSYLDSILSEIIYIYLINWDDQDNPFHDILDFIKKEILNKNIDPVKNDELKKIWVKEINKKICDPVQVYVNNQSL